MSDIDGVGRAVAVFRDQAQSVTSADMGRATPCAGWDVRTLIEHVVGIYTATSDALHGARVDLVAASRPFDDAPERVIDDAAAAMMQAWREPGALDRTLATTIRDMPAALATRILIGDSLLHGWDLARALGHEMTMPDDLAAAQLEMMQQYYDPATRGPGRGFDLAVEWPADAPVQERLLALSGRDPSWSPDVAVPDVIRRYFAAQDRRETDAALSTFGLECRVFDDGREYVGRAAIRDWLAGASTQFTYTRTFLDAAEAAPNDWLIRNRLEGNFPGGVVDLGYRFRLVDDLIVDLDIQP
jgi:uncharacterized protein (TIGR03086 family)